MGILLLGVDFAVNLWLVSSGANYQKAIAPAFINKLAVYGLLALLLGLCLGILIASGWKRLFWILGLVPGLPVLFLGLALLHEAPGEINRVQLADGRLLMLGIQPVPTDDVYDLWQSEDIYGLVWKRLSDVSITYSEDGSWTKDPALIVTPDGKYLLIRRGGIWTDCLIIAETFEQCPGVSSYLDWTEHAEWIQQSDKIEHITGLSPGPKENRQPVRQQAINAQ